MIYRDEVNQDYFIVKYYLDSKTDLNDAVWSLAVGQSVGNPNIRNRWETDQLFEKYACVILDEQKRLTKQTDGVVNIAFPLANIDLNTDGISQLLCQIMGGQLDIDIIEKCHILDINIPIKLNRPKFGIDGIRTYTNVFDKPLLGAIIKPKTGISPQILFEIVKALIDGGVNFIKEDEIMSNPTICPLEKRLELISPFLSNNNVIYAVCINSDPLYLLDRVRLVHQLGGNAVHVNFWSGLGSYKSIRDLDLPLFLFFQKSGDKILTNPKHNFHIKWDVICKLAGMMGVDFIHSGMWGGYSGSDSIELLNTMRLLQNYNVMPSLSCGMHPGLVHKITSLFGSDYLANVGGAIHGHTEGTKSGARAMRQAIDGNFGPEYYRAIDQFGLVK